jgi:hypothetical protein
LSVYSSVRMEQLGSYLTDFHEIWYEYFSKIRRENSSLIKVWQEWRVLYTKTDIHYWSYLAQLFLEWEMFHTKL